MSDITETPGLPTERIPVIYIASQGHSGSTLLAQLLGRHNGAISLGEIANLADLEQKCTCNANSITECTFWQRVDRLLRDSEGRGLRDLQMKSTEPDVFRADNLALFRAARSASGNATLVDASKVIDRLSRLNEIPELEITPIFLRRHPAGVVNSNVRKGRNWFKQTITHYGPSRQRVEYFRGLDHIKVNYSELVAAPDVELPSLMTSLGMTYEPSQLLWAEGERHDVGGNRMRFSEDSTIRMDNSWQESLGTFQKLVINALLSDAMIENDLIASSAKFLKPILGPNRKST